MVFCLSRLAGQKDLEFFPTQDTIIPLIRSYLSFPEEGTTVLDPCCADGDAVLQLCPDQFHFGMELNTTRALQAKATNEFIQCLAGPFEKSTFSNLSFVFIHLNPPIDWVSGGGDRYEEIFLYRASNYLAHGGVLELLVPGSLFQYKGAEVIKHLLSNYQDIRIYKYPEPEYQLFKQIVVFGVKKPSERITATPEWLEEQVALITTGDIPVLAMQDAPIYHVPAINPGMVKVFRCNHYDAVLARSESRTLSILQSQSMPVLKDQLTAPYPLDKASLALLAVGGYVDGKMPGHYLLGQYENREVTSHDIDDDGSEITITQKKSSTIFRVLLPMPGPDGSRILTIV